MNVAVDRGVWRPPPLIRNPWLRYGLAIAALVYLWFAISSVDVNWTRALQGMDRGLRFIQGFLSPDFGARAGDIWLGLVESITMTITATAAGIALSVPIALGASRNLVPAWIYYVCRSIIAVSRSLQEIVVAILLVALFGFGPFAGFVTLAFATIGFMGKLLADAIEEANRSQLEAIRSTGASWWQWVSYAVQPQVAPRLIGLSLYRLDINFRDSAIVGIVGAGGIGATLNTAIDRYEYDVAGAILLIIIGIVLAVELSSSWIRKKVQ